MPQLDTFRSGMDMLEVPTERMLDCSLARLEELGVMERPLQKSEGFARRLNLPSETVKVDELEKALEQVFESMCGRLVREFKGILTESLHQVQIRNGHVRQVSKDAPSFERRNSTTKAVHDEIAELFKIIDKDSTGELQKAEFIRAFRTDMEVVAFCKKNRRLAALLDPKTFGATFANIDADNSGSIDLEEFRSALEEADVIDLGEDADGDAVLQLFRMLDSDGMGTVAKDQFVRALKMNNVVISFCKQHAELKPLLNPSIFKSSFAQVEGYDAKSISLLELRGAVNIIKKTMEPDVDLAVIDKDDRQGVNVTLSPRNEEEPLSPREDGAAMGAADSKLQKELEKANAKHMNDELMDQEVYNVEDFYWQTGYAQAVARSEWFINSTLLVISVNAVYLGVDADHNTAELLLDSGVGFILMEYLFCVFFVFEWTVRFCAFQRKCNCLRDNWFKFDSFLVLLMVMETWIMPFILPVISAGAAPPPTGPLRLLRLLRLSRLIRLMRSFPELVIIIKGMFAAFRAVGSSLLMVAILVYLFAIVMHMLLKDDDSQDVRDYFGTLPRCMWTLLMNGTLLDDVSEVLSFLVFRGDFNATVAVCFFLVFILVTALTVMNMLIGVLCEVVTTVAANEKEEAAINVMRQTILLELKKYDDGDGFIDEDELNDLMADPASVGVLDSLGIDVNFLQDLQVMTFSEPGVSMDMKGIIEQMLSCRRDLPVSVQHLVMAHKLSHFQMCNTVEQHEERLKKEMAAAFNTC